LQVFQAHLNFTVSLSMSSNLQRKVAVAVQEEVGCTLNVAKQPGRNSAHHFMWAQNDLVLARGTQKKNQVQVLRNLHGAHPLSVSASRPRLLPMRDHPKMSIWFIISGKLVVGVVHHQ
jgi:hypothetical protein